MNHRFTLLAAGVLVVVVSSLSLTGCIQDQCNSVRTYVQMDPVYVTPEQLLEAVEILPARELEDPGKIYAYGDYILVNERYKGLHIIDNSNPAQPQNAGFLNIPGNVDMAIRNNVLYADHVHDLLAIDVSDMLNPVVSGVVEGVFEDARFYPYVDGQGYIVDYNPTTVTMEIDCEDPRYQDDWWFQNEDVLFLSSDLASSESNNSGNVTGTGGSMARFTLSQGHLYTVGDASLNVFDLGLPNQPVLTQTVHLGWGVETIYPYEDKLFIGSRTGMYLFDNRQPSSPVLMSEYSHWTSCDPVVVEGTTAYVTLRGGRTCDGFVNQLEIIDIEDITAPRLISTWPMVGPYGLAIRDEVLYLCDGNAGLKVFDVATPEAIVSLTTDQRMNTYDVISLSDSHLLCVGEDGLYQFDTTDKNKLLLLSIIPVQ